MANKTIALDIDEIEDVEYDVVPLSIGDALKIIEAREFLDDAPEAEDPEGYLDWEQEANDEAAAFFFGEV